MATTPSYARDNSRDRSESRLVKHSHSYSECMNRPTIPMWDSSDPERAPPPLPLNPSLANSPITKPNVSSNIEKAAALIASRALESAPSAYTSNPPPSPDKGIVRPHHRRMQSVQTGNTSPTKLSDSLERRSPDKGFRNSRLVEWEDRARTADLSPVRAGSDSPTPLSKSKSFTDENTPPSAGMLALQSARNRQENEPLADVTNGVSRSQPSFDVLSSQITTITNIATNLQREMASLTKRSKDNASDLGRLQEATNVRDEDIRKTLRDLVSGLDQKFGNIDSRLLGAPDSSRAASSLPLFYDEQHTTPSRKSFNVPRIASPASFLDRDLTASPSVVSVDGAASIAMLEKVLREMATKDGQEKLMSTLEIAKTEAQHAPEAPRSAMDPGTMQKLEEILLFMQDMKADSGSKALVRSPSVKHDRRMSHMDAFLDGDKSRTQTSDLVNDEVIKTLKTVKQSLSQHGGLTNEIKALVRELRGEVLGMGREIAKKLDHVPSSNGAELQLARSAPDNDEIVQIVEEGLLDLKKQMQAIVHNNDKQLSRSQPDFDSSALITAVTTAISQHKLQDTSRDIDAEREQMLVAIREAWEDCKPEIALEHFGLERDEILDTLKEGLQSYQPQNRSLEESSITYDQVLGAVQAGLATFQPPQLEAPPSISKEDIAVVVQHCLENFDFPNSALVRAETSDPEVTRDFMLEAIDDALARHSNIRSTPNFSKSDILDAVREGLERHPPTVSKDVEFNREDLFDAIKACLEGENNPLGGMGERVVEAMHEFLGSMKTEFQEYTAANGRDTEQVLDAVKDGLEDLRGEIESYVDRASDVTNKDEIVDVVKAGFAAMQTDMEKGFSRSNQAVDTPELLDAMEKEFEHLRDTIRKSLTTADLSSDKHEILDAIRDITDDRGSSLSASSNGDDIAKLVKDELEHLRTTLAGTLIKPSSVERDDIVEAVREAMESNRSAPRGDGESILSNTSELLDAFQDGVDNLRSDIKKMLEQSEATTASQELLDSLNAGIDNIRSDIELLKANRYTGDEESHGREVMLHDENGVSAQIDALKVMITQLGIKIEAIDLPTPDVNIPSEMRVHTDDMGALHSAMANHARRSDLDAVHASIREMHDTINTLPRDMPVITMPDIPAPEVVMPANAACKEDVDAIETLLHNIKAKLDESLTPDLASVAKASEVAALQDLVRELHTNIDSSSARMTESTNKEDFTILQLTLKDIAASVEGLKGKVGDGSDFAEGETRLTKTDLEVLESLCLDMKAKVDEQSIPSVDGLATKEDVVEISENLKAFREQLESDNDLTAQAFEARKIEHGGLATKIDDVKSLVAEIKDEVLGKLTSNDEGIVELSKVLGMHHDNMDMYATAASISELSDLVTKAFDAHIDAKSSNKSETEERDATLFSKVDEQHNDLRSRIEEKFNELMTKYDDAQIISDAKMAAMEERDQHNSENNASVKGVVEELKALMDSLSSSVNDTCEKLSNDSKTVFEVVDQSNLKLTEMVDANAHEHSITREEIAKTLDATSRLETYLHEPHPEILSALREVLEKVGKHYEHSQLQDEKFTKATEEIRSEVKDIPSAIPSLLPALPSAESPSTEPLTSEKYDDSEMQSKLDELISHSAFAKEAFATMDSHHNGTSERLQGLEKLDAIHEKVHSTSDEIVTMLAEHKRLLAEHNETKAEEAREAAIALEKRTAQKERVEAEIVSLTDEKTALIDSMAALRREHEELFAQTKRLTRDVAKLETSLMIRREEMRDMNDRAESLERRILEGVMNHARTAQFPKMRSKKRTSPAERDASMNLKRVPSTNNNPAVRAPSQLGNAVGMALKKRAPLAVTSSTNAAGRQSIDRRILSTSHVQNNQGKSSARALVLAPTHSSGFVGLKRSQSVKSNPSTYLSGRKPSWTGVESSLADKENSSTIDDETLDDQSSDAGTERRTSLGTSYMYTDSSVSRNSHRSASYASSLGGTLNGYGQDSILEEDEDEHDDSEHDIEDLTYREDQSKAMVLAGAESVHSDHSDDSDEDDFEDADTVGDLPTSSDIVHHESKYVMPSDSGIGSEPPTPDQSTKGWQSAVST